MAAAAVLGEISCRSLSDEQSCIERFLAALNVLIGMDVSLIGLTRMLPSRFPERFVKCTAISCRIRSDQGVFAWEEYHWILLSDLQQISRISANYVVCCAHCRVHFPRRGRH